MPAELQHMTIHELGALLRCAHCYARQAEWHLHRPPLQ